MEEHVAVFRSSTTRWLLGSFAGWMTSLLCLVGIGLVIVLIKWLENVGTRYELTTQRLIIKTGIIFKKIDEVELYRVKDIRVEFSLLNQMVNIGNIFLKTSDVTTNGQSLVLDGIPDARAIRERMRTLVDTARQARRVRELDMDYAGG